MDRISFVIGRGVEPLFLEYERLNQHRRTYPFLSFTAEKCLWKIKVITTSIYPHSDNVQVIELYSNVNEAGRTGHQSSLRTCGL